jgi:hypothetical protein
MRSQLRMLLLPSLLATLGACATPTPIPVTEGAPVDPCKVFARISFDRLSDTVVTIEQVKAYDAARDSLCGVGK